MIKKEKTYNDLSFQNKVLYQLALQKGEWNLIYIVMFALYFSLVSVITLYRNLPISALNFIFFLSFAAWWGFKYVKYHKRLRKFIGENT